MTVRHRGRDSSGAAAALAVGLLVVAAGALGGAWYFVKQRSDPAPAEDAAPGLGEFERAVPWDHVRIDDKSGEFVMIVDGPATWDLSAGEMEDFFSSVEDCREYAGKSLGEFYPEAEGRLLRVRVRCAATPPERVLAKLRAIAALGGDVAYDLAVDGPGGALKTTSLRE